MLLAGGALVAAGVAGVAWLAFRRPDDAAPPDQVPEGICRGTPPSSQPQPPAGWRQYSGAVSSVATSAAVHALSLPWGTWTTFTDAGGELLGILRMWHCHEPDSGAHPIGWHQGSTLYRPA